MKQKSLLSFLFMLFAFMAWGQTRQVTGQVKREGSAENLAGVSVTVKGTKTATSTDNAGRFSITVPDRNDVVLVFTSIGLGTTEFPLGSSSAIEVSMKEEATTLSDVVVVGYQTVRRRDLTGSVSSIGSKQLADNPVNSAAEALAGRLAGVQVTGTEGAPNAQFQIRVRGGGSITQNNTPLYIIDGVQVENGLNSLSPQDIESIDVLKDASTTAIYGARGANGVVIITTKGGKNAKPTISYNGMVGYKSLANRLDVMNPHDFVVYQYERSRASSADSTSFAKTYGTTFDTLKHYRNAPFVNWQDEMFGRSAMMQTHNVSLTGGNAGTTYNLSLTSNNEEGIMERSDFSRKLASFRFDHTFSKALKIGFNTRYNNTIVNGAGTSAEGSASTNRLRQSVKYRPLLLSGLGLDDYDPAYAAETNANSLALVNPILLNAAEYRRNNSGTLNLSGYVNLALTKYLTFRTTGGIDMTNSTQQAFDDSITNNSKGVGGGQPLAWININKRTTINNSNVLTFSNQKLDGSFNKRNDISVLAGQEIYQTKSTGNYTETRYFPLGITPERALGNMNLGTTPAGVSQPKPTSFDVTDRIASFFGRINYNYDGKYLLALSLRADGSTKFAEENRWGYFPSGSFAWRVSQEKFFDQYTQVVNDLKLRVGYGKAGNNRISDLLYTTVYNTNTQYGLMDQSVTGFNPPTLANPNLVWEATTTRNFGIDLGFLKNRIQLSFDVYRNSVSDLLVNIPIDPTLGYANQIQNVGATSNRGYEIQLNGTPVQNKNLTWTANFNLSHNKNKVESLGDRINFFLVNSGWGFSNTPADYIVRVGDPVGSIYGFTTDGFYTTNDFDYNTTTGVYTLKAGVPSNASITSIAQPGALKFKDISGPKGVPDSLINDFDKKIIGDANPKFFGGLGQQLTYKNFDLSVFLNFQVGNDVYNANKLEFTSGYTPNSNMLDIMNDRWRTIDANGVVLQRVTTISGSQVVVGAPPAVLNAANANAKLWMPSQSSTSFVMHSWAVEDGSFVRLNNVTIGYTLPKSATNKIFIQKARFYVTANNLKVWTKYSGYDPEVSTRRNNLTTPGVDYSAYPRSRSFIAGINLTF
jgi:TonB-dependent starch-binding outer membrane protein SusC